jgi:deoxyadenosine/deoxycytidine kinase
VIRIEICGGIATGKTALASCLIQYGSFCLVQEKYREIPFWEKFYSSPEDYAFEKNISFLLFHGDAIRSAIQPGSRDIVCDFAMFQDLAYAGLSTGGEGDLKIIQALYDRLMDRIGFPSVIVRLKCAPATQLERIHRRGRNAERAIEQGYLVRLADKIDENLARLTQQRDIPVVDIDTDRCDFVANPEALAISSRLGDLVQRIKNT